MRRGDDGVARLLTDLRRLKYLGRDFEVFLGDASDAFGVVRAAGGFGGVVAIFLDQVEVADFEGALLFGAPTSGSRPMVPAFGCFPSRIHSSMRFIQPIGSRLYFSRRASSRVVVTVVDPTGTFYETGPTSVTPAYAHIAFCT